MTEDQVIRKAIAILETRLQKKEAVLQSPSDASNYLILRMSQLPYEVFGMLFLDNRHAVIEARDMFTGTIDGTSVFPREVVRAVIETNAAAVIVYHNHPSGIPEPSYADERLTRRLSDALELIDVRVLDHIIVGGVSTVSLASRGMI